MTVTQINELKAQRKKSIDEARKLHEKAHADNKRALTTEEQTQYDNHLADEARFKTTIDREERLAGLEPENRKANTERETPELDDNADPEQRAEAEKERQRRDSKQYRAAFNKWLTRGASVLSPQEYRDLSADNDTEGGFLVAPQTMVGEMLKNLDDTVYVRGKARKFTLVKAKSLGVIKRTGKMSTWARGGEITPPTKDQQLAFGKRALHPQYMSGLALVSRDLLRNSSVPAEQIVRDELALNAGEVQEQEFMTGSGAGGQALGVFTNSSDGIGASRDMSTDNTGTAVTAEGLINAKYHLKEAYRRTAEWMFSRSAVKMIAKLKDLEGRFLWEPSLKAGEADRIIGLPYVESEWVPNTFTTGLYVGILANWNYYWIADALDMEIQVLKELYALSNQDGFAARLKMDAAPQLEEAFVRVKLG